MLLKILGPFGHEEESAIDTVGLSLGALLGDYKPSQVRINRSLEKDWRSYVPRQGDVVQLEFQAADFGIISGPVTAAGVAGAVGTSATVSAVIAGVLNAVIALTISMALSGIVRALTPKPKKAKADSNGKEAFGISGFQNTAGRGTPAFIPYGRNRIFGHVISSGATLSPDGKTMRGRVLYFMGDTGGDGIESISQIRIDGTASDQYPEVSFYTRQGFDVQPVIPEFENRDNLFTDGRALAFNPEEPTATTPIIYTTRGDDVNRATLFISFPSGLYRVGDTGKHRTAGVNQTIEIRPNSGGPWQDAGTAQWFEMITSGIFKTYEINFPSAGKWDIRVTTIAFVNWKFGEGFVGASNLFNVQETVFTTKTYPGWALLGLTDIPAEKVRSLETMNVSALVDGKRVTCPQPGGGFIHQFTRKRCWIVRDMMTHPKVGMGSEIDPSEIDDAQWLESQDYYDEFIAGHGGLEERDLCDVIINDLDWDWEWVKKVAGEARGRIIPSADKWKYVIDKPGTPNILYAEGANIIENSITIELAPADKPFTEITGQFRDADKDYEDNFSPAIINPEAVSVVQEQFQYISLTRESEVQRENRIIFKRNFLENRRWQFTSPLNAIVSEPMDLDYIAERGIGNEGAYSGFVGIGSTTDTIVLPEPMVVIAGFTYAAIIKHAADNTTEYRLVLTGPGTWGAIVVRTPFIQAPVESDIYSVGIENVEHVVTRAQELEIDQDGRVRQVRTIYDDRVYTDDPLPPKSVRRFFGIVDNRLPIPLRDAQVREEAAMNRDGSVRSILIFDVTPGLQFNTDLCLGGSLATHVVLASSEPDRDGYYNTAQLTVRNESRIISTYTGVNRVAEVSEPFSFIPVGGEPYQIQWLRFAVYGGFRVEQSDDGINFVNLSRVFDIHWETDGRGAGPGPVYFRFTPISEQGAENTIAQITQGIFILGDLSAPSRPAFVTITSHLLDVRVLVQMQRPVAEDFASVEVELWRTALDPSVGVMIEKARFGSSADSASTGFMNVECNFNLGARTPPEPYGSVIWARARAKDYSDNPLEGTPEYDVLLTDSELPTTLNPDPNATGGGGEAVSIPTGLSITTGTQLDPVDGTIKVFIDGHWNPNPESSISQYEFQYRQLDDFGVPVPGAITDRIVFHPQVSVREIGVLGNTIYQGRVQAINGQNVPSGFTAFTPITNPLSPGRTERDRTAPVPPSINSVIGGFRMVSIFFVPPANTPDFQCVEVWFSFSPANPAADKAGESAARSIQFVHSGLLDDTTYYYWLRSKDTSGNVGAFNGPIAATTKLIGPNDVVAENLITQSAQIGDALITNAHITDLAVSKVLAGTVNVVFGIGVGNQVYIHGPGGYVVVVDNTTAVPGFPTGVPRVLLGKVGTGIADYGLQVFGPTGALFYSITSGTLTEGRQDQNQSTFSGLSFAPGNISNRFVGVFAIENTINQFIVRVRAAGISGSGGKGGATFTSFASQDFTVTHNKGKTMAISPSLASISESLSGGVPCTATLLVHYW